MKISTYIYILAGFSSLNLFAAGVAGTRAELEETAMNASSTIEYTYIEDGETKTSTYTTTSTASPYSLVEVDSTYADDVDVITKYLIGTDDEGNVTYTPVYYRITFSDLIYGTGDTTTLDYYWKVNTYNGSISTTESETAAFRVSYSEDGIHAPIENSSSDIVDGVFIGNTTSGVSAISNVNNSATISISGTFLDNGTSGNNGTAIYNENSNIDVIDGVFMGNTAYDGVVYNDGGSINLITGSFVGNYVYYGSIYNGTDGIIYNIAADFIGNTGSYATSIRNSTGAYIGSITGNFMDNTQINGTIYNAGTIDSIDATFISNYGSSNGGAAIANEYTGYIDSISGDFIENTSVNGGAILNWGEIGDISGYFIGNTASYSSGGAIINSKVYITSDETTYYSSINSISGYFAYNSAAVYGGAIYNTLGASIGSISGEYSSNDAQIGGAIFNYGDISSISGDFNGNSVSGYGYGGAIANWTGSIEVITQSTFTGNSASTFGGAIFNYGNTIGEISQSTFTENSAAYGGAIFNYYSNSYITLVDSSFYNNTATTSGGAIQNQGYLTVKAETMDSVFSGNTAGGSSSGIYSSCSLALMASNGYSVIFNDAITGSGVLSINADGSTGSIVLNADMTGFEGSTTFSQGSIYIGADMGIDDDGYTNFLGGSFVVDSTDYSDAALLDAANAVLDNFDTSQWETTTELSVGIDVSIGTESADFFDLTGDSLDINITELNILDEALVTDVLIAVSDAAEGFSLAEDQYEIVTDNYTYTIEDVYINGDYFLKISSTANIPEPSTATLSLLALTALLARRRRQAVV